MNMTQLEKAIMRTLGYFDLLDYPLTATEVWTWLYCPACPPGERSLMQVSRVIEESVNLKPYVERTEGFYHLRGRSYLVPQRKMRNIRVDEQMRKTVRIVKLLRLFPSIRMIAIASSLSFGNVKEESDIDLFIIAKKGQIWLARLFAVGLLKLLRQRPCNGKTKDRFCLAFFITEDNLNISHASLGPDDIVFQYYVQSFMPLYDPFGVYNKFLTANKWWSKYLPNAYHEQRLTVEVGCPPWLYVWHTIFEVVTWLFFHGPWGMWHQRLQLRILPDRLKSQANINSNIIISDAMLKFHDRDNRRQMLKVWQERVAPYV